MPKSYAERNAKKKKKEFVNSQTPSVSQRNTPAKEEARRQRFNNNSNRRLTASERAAAARDQKMGLPTSEEIRRAEEERKRKAEERRQTVQKQQRVKSGIQTEEDNQYFQERRDTAKRALKNTPTLAKKAIKDTGSGYMQTLADVDEMVKSNEKWTSAKAMKMGIDTNDKKQMQDIEEERKRNVEESRKFRLELNEAQEKRQAEWDKRSKGAKGLEKAYYGAVESGVGMAADLAVGALSGTGQLGALASMGVRTYGTVRGQAEKEGATENEDRLYSLMQAGKEVGTELMFAGAGLAKGAYAGSKSLSIADRVASRVTRNMTGRAADAAYAGVRLLGGTAEENIEEIAGWGLDPLIRDVAYGRNLRKRQQKEILQAESDALRSNIRSEDDVRAVSAMLGSDDFLETYKNQYVGAGLSEKQATKVAEKMRDYLTASLTGDTDKMADLEDEIANLVGNKGLSASDWNKQELKETIASTSLLTLTTGLPGNVSTAVKGASIRDQLGESGINELVSAAVDFEDETASKRAQVAKDRLAEGKELTATQVYELTVAQDQQVRKDQQRLSAKNNMVQATIQNDNLVMPRIVLNNDGSISGDEIVTQEYTRNANEAAEAIRNKSKESLTDTEVDNGSRAIAGFMTGAFTIGDANTLTYSNEAVREAFKDATGVDLEQYVVRDKNGKVKIPETNAKTKDALFAMAADNFVQTAQAETENWMDHASGEVITQVNKRLGASGTVALQNALQDVDVRDRTNYLMTTNALDMTYQAGRNIGTEWDNIKDTVIATYPGVDDTKLQAVYEAGRSDRDAANDNARNRGIKKGQSVKEMGEQGEVAGNLLIETEAPPKETVIRTFTEIASTLGVNIHLTDQILNEKGEEVTGANGTYYNGEIYLNVNTAVEQNVGYIFMHEVTHHLKQFAPEEYQALENLVRERWFKADAEQMQAAIQRKIDAYAKVEQNLSEENALEEIIADAAHEFINDRNFAEQVAEDSPSLAKAILNSVREALRKLRRILSLGNIEDETHMNSLFSELNILSEAEELWLNAYKVAVQNRAANAIEQWDENARNQNAESEEAGFSLSDSNISSYSTDAYSGQVNMRTEYKDDSGNVLGYVEWNDYEGEPNISYIHVNEDSRRQGIARKLLQNIQKQYPGTEINFGMTTEDGTALLDAVTDTVVDDEIKSRQDELAQKNQELASIESRLNELYDVDERTPEQESEASELGEQWDNLYREIHDLNEEVGDRSSTRRMVRLSVTEDSVGRRLTEAQQNFFQDSKIVDSEGNLKVMYHGTPNMGFTVFDRRKSRPGTLGRGFYFSDQDSHAGQYGARYEVYLNIKQPLAGETHDITKDQLRAFVEEIAEDEDYGIDNYGYGATVDSVVDDVWGKSDFRMIQDINLACVGDMAEAVKLFNSVNDTNYDGIVTDTETVAFYPNQIKNVDNENPTEDPDIRYSRTTEEEDLPKGGALPASLKSWAKEVGLNTLTKQEVKGPVIVSVRGLRTAWYDKNGRSEEAKTINTALKSVSDSLTNLVGQYRYIDLSDALNATVHYRTDSKGKATSVILSCQVKNAEYEVNFDFTTICAKRLAMQKVLEKFIKTEGEKKGTLYDELKLDEEGMYKLRLILETAGFEVSCRGCFVEQNRYSQQAQAKTIADDWNAALDAWAEENGTEVTENFDLVNMDTNSLNYEEIEEGFKRYHELMKGKSANVETKNRMLIEASPFFRKRMNSSDYASLSGQRALMAIGESKKGGTSLYGLLKRGQSDSKQSVPFTAYNGEVALLPDNMKGKSIRDYLLSIGGARAQSASDFQIEFLYDYMQLVADLSARDLPMHMYTKVIELAELFGMTGIKINLSAMCDVDENLTGEYAGLKLVDGKYEYNISDQSIDYPKAVELQKRDGYSKNIGIIMVALSSQHMLKSLDDPDVRYIIGYHSSAMPVVVANMSKMGDATDYTKLNKTNQLTDKGRALFDEAMQEAKGDTELAKFKDALRIFEEKIQQDVEETSQKKKKAKPRRGNEYASYMKPYKGNTADFNTYEDIQKTNDARKTADNYIEWCMKNDYIPMYFPFAFHENYYKCEVYDFNMYDNNTGEYAPMESVKNIYPGLNMAAGETDTTEFMGRVSEMMSERNAFNEVQDQRYEPVFEQAKQELRRFSITGDEYVDFDAAGIDRSELTHRADAIKTEAQLRDESYMNAVEAGNMDEAQRLVDEAAHIAMPDTKLGGLWLHGTNNEFTKFDFSQGQKNGSAEGFGIYLTNNPEIASSYGNRIIRGYVNVKRPASTKERTISKKELKKLIRATIEAEHNRWGTDLRDTWISNYVNPYEMSLDNAISEVAKELLSYEDNDRDMIEELRLAQGIRSYEYIPEYYDLVTEATGIDGLYTEWEDGETGQVNPITIAFRSSQIKSSDPVTYAEDGSVIPLSERFNPDNNDIRYSLPTQDSDGNILTDGQMEYFKNSQARDEKGRLLPMYHATPNGGFTIFNPSYSFDGTSISFTDDLDFALNYAAEEDDIEAQVQASENRLGDGERRGRGHYEVYLNMENPLVVDGSGIVFNDEVYDLTAQAKHEGYDGLIMRNFQDLGADIYQVFSGKQVKDTRNTDPTNNPDIRYSIPSENAFIASASETATSTDEVWYTDPALEEGRVRYSYSKQDFINGKSDYWNPAWLTEGRVLDDKSVKRSIRTVVQGAMMNSNTPAQYRTSLVDSLVKDARKAFNLMKQGKHSEAAAMLFDSAYDMIENVEFFEDDTAFDRYKELRDYFKGFKLTIDERYYNDINIADYRKRNMGRILIGRNGTNIDEAWEDLSNRWPEWFSMDTEHPAEMLEQLEHVFDAAKPVAVAYSSEEAMEFAGDIADDLYDIIYEGKEFKSLADKYDAKTKAMKLRHQEAMQKMQDSLDAEKERRRYEVKKLKEENKRKLNTQKNKFEFEIAELRQNRDYNIERLKAEKSRAVQEERQKRKDAEARERAQKSHRKEFTRFHKNYDWLVSRLLSPTKDKNIPEELRIPLAKLMMQFDLQTQRSKDLEKKYGVANATLQLRELKDKITKIAKEDDSGELPANPWLIGSIEQLTDAFDGKPVDWMGTEDIILLNEVLSSLVHGIQNQQKVRINGKLEEIAGFGDKTIENLKDRIKKFGQRKSYIKGIDQINRLLNEGEETPIYFFSRIDPKKEGIGAMYRELRLGEDKHIRNMDYLRRRFKDITGEYAKNKQPGSRLEDWRSMHNAQTFELENGTITLTPAQLMSLYCLSNRDDAKGHLLTGGIVATPVSFGATMKDALKPRDQKVSSTKITYEDLQSMITKLTPEQKKMADELQKLMAEEMAEWGNQTSMEMYGIKMFRDPNYFPMRSSQMELASDPNNPGKDTAEKIRNFGFTKPLTPNANNAVYIDDIFSVVADHCNKMSLYNSMAIPIMDFMKVYNYKQRNDDGSTVTLKATIGDAFTTKANGYIEKFLADLNGNTQTKSDAVDALFKTALANYKKAAIGANMRVALQQPTAIFRAFQAIDPKWFAGVKPSSKAVKEMQEHCPIALWKSWGHYEMDMSRDMEDIMMNNDWSKMDTITMGLYGFLDNVTWGMIWQATKKEVKANNPDVEEGSEEFWNLCNERASEIFDKTQVVDSMFHRSETMRSKATLTKMATSFMAEPTLTYNVFRNSLVTGAEMWRSGDKAGARKTWGRTFTVLMFNAAAVSAGAAIWDAVRGKGDDEKDPKTKFQLFYDNFMANFGENAPWQMWHNIYFVKDIADIKKGVEEGWGGTSNMALEGFETMFRGWNQVKKKMHGEAKKTTWYDAFTNLIGGTGYILGVPSKTIMRDFKGICKSLGLELQVFAATDSPAVLQNAMPELEEGGWADKVVKLFTGSDSGSSETSEGSSSGEGTSSGKTKDATSEAMKLGKKAVKNIGRNAYKKREKSEEEMLAEINEKTVGYSGADRDQRIWNIVSDGYSDYINKGDYEYIDKMRKVVQQAGGNLDSFDKKVMDASKTAMKKTIIANPTQAQVEQQDRIRDYLLTHGMSESEISAEICYKSNTARDLKAAMRLNNKDYMVEELVPLLRAGITRDDIYKLYKYRNMGAKTYDGKYSAPEYKQSTGKYEWPINGQITSGFGHRSSPGGIGSTNHQGLDIAGNMGDPIGAADGGTVVYVGWYGGAGNTVMIQHDDGTVTQYSHMSAFNCQEGDTVSQGQQIGQVGSTGNSTGPHCHFAVKVNDTYVDPLTYLQG